ncbi:MAG: PrsW family intramembrane metalloprotease, partial [Planctomycetes bacterium]|nr:PrsW family intramembrane metalloprotease [Planctomycetota bacterium]
PFSDVELRQLAQRGSLTPTTLVRASGMQRSIPASRIGGLFPAPSVAPPPLSPLPPLPELPASPAEAIANSLGIPSGQALFRESAPTSRPAVETQTATTSARPTTRRIAPLEVRPTTSLHARAPIAPPPLRPQPIPLAAPPWRDLWPLAVVVLGLGWGVGGLLTFEQRYTPDSGFAIFVLALAALPLATLAFLHWLRPRHVPWGSAVFALIFTAIGGILTLLAMQWAAAVVAGGRIRFFGKAAIILVVLFAIGWAYHMTESDSFLMRWVGYVFGVGLCEEAVKLLPLAWMITGAHRRMGLHGFMMIGFASGIGFGVAEALYLYNPWHDDMPAEYAAAGFHAYRVPEVGGNVIRWFALVPSHAMWTAACAAFLWKWGDDYSGSESFWGKAWVVAKAAGLMAFIHGTYDAICSLGTIAAAIASATSFAALAWVGYYFTTDETDPPEVPAQPALLLTHRVGVLAAGLCAAAVLLVPAIAMGTDQRSWLRAVLPPAIRPYLAGLALPPDRGAVGLVLDCRLDEEVGIVGTLVNKGASPLSALTVTCIDEKDERHEMLCEELAPGGSWKIDPDEWLFAPAEQVEVTWEGQEQPVHFTLP